jgi:hypothetical protein
VLDRLYDTQAGEVTADVNNTAVTTDDATINGPLDAQSVSSGSVTTDDATVNGPVRGAETVSLGQSERDFVSSGSYFPLWQQSIGANETTTSTSWTTIQSRQFAAWVDMDQLAQTGAVYASFALETKGGVASDPTDAEYAIVLNGTRYNETTVTDSNFVTLSPEPVRVDDTLSGMVRVNGAIRSSDGDEIGTNSRFMAELWRKT